MKQFCTESQKALPSVGINPLTGEACAYSMRVLCDLSADGALLVGMFLGMENIQFRKNWNSKVGEEDAIASVMLPRSIFRDLILFALYQKGFTHVFQSNVDLTYYAYTKGEPELDRYLELFEKGNFKTWTLHYNPSGDQPHVGDRNIHQFTGRTD